MTRYTRAKGSKASNEKTPDDATPWHVMKQQLMENLNKNEETKGNVKTAKELLKEKEEPLYYGSLGNVKNDWAEFEETNAKKANAVSAKVNKMEKKQKQKVQNIEKPTEIIETEKHEGNNAINKKSKRKSEQINDSLVEEQNGANKKNKNQSKDLANSQNGNGTINEITSKKKNTDDNDTTEIDSGKNEEALTKKKSSKRKIEQIDNPIIEGKDKMNKKHKNQSNDTTNIQDGDDGINEVMSKKKKKKRSNDSNIIETNSGKSDEINVTKKKKAGENTSTTDTNQSTEEAKTVEEGRVVLTKRQKRNRKNRKENKIESGNNDSQVSNATLEQDTSQNEVDTKTPNNENNEQNENASANRPLEKFNPNFTNKFNSFDRNTNKFGAKRFDNPSRIHKSQRPAKIRDDKEHKRRKADIGPTKMTINGIEIEIVKFDGFPVKKEDAERLTDLKQQMIMRGIPKKDIDTAMKLERRKAEKALARIRKCVCFHCRKSGHNLSDCPELGSEQAGTGICFKCGSTEHTHFECKVAKQTEYRYATCFICREQGHISKQCPDNPKGIYPQGGACKVCGDVTHLKKDCPDLIKEKEESTLTVDTMTNDGLESLETDEKKVSERYDQKAKSKVVKF